MRNVSLLPQGGFRRRPATTFEYDLAIPQAQLAEFIFASDAQYLVVFTANEVRVFDALAAPVSLLATLGSAPWGAGDLASLYWAQSGGTLVVTHPNLFPQRLLRTGPSSFSLAPWIFENHSSGFPIYQPYYKFAPETISLTPSGTTGAITLTTSAGYWVPGHVGMRVRYQKKTCTITGTSATVVAATVNGTRLTGASSIGTSSCSRPCGAIPPAPVSTISAPSSPATRPSPTASGPARRARPSTSTWAPAPTTTRSGPRWAPRRSTGSSASSPRAICS